jgi:hypothetical protein
VTMASNLSVNAAFNLQTYAITATATTGGSISPSGSVRLNGGGSQTFTITPNSGYTIQNIVVDGSPVDKSSSYAFSNIAANHTIQATFSQTSRVPRGLAKKR